jgi:hypothetical protein
MLEGRYQGKPFLRILELYVLKAINELDKKTKNYWKK